MAAKYTEVANDEIFEEQIEVENQNDDGRTAICDVCYLDVNARSKDLASFLCFVCNKYYCKKCFIGHDGSHKYINVESEEWEQEAAIDEYMDYVKGESKKNDDGRTAICDVCYLDVNARSKDLASFLCFVCNKYYCKKCFIGHDGSHKYINVESEEWEQEAAIDEYMDYVKGESKRGRKLMKEDVCVCDFVDIKHGLDKEKGYYNITGLCGTSAGWVVCDYSNYCIKLFSLGTNVLQRYIRVWSRPHDVTEILGKQNFTELDSASSSSSNISGTDVKPDRTCLLAVTLSWEPLILIIDLSKNPAKKVRNIKMENECWGIEFYDDKFFTICTETLDSRGPLWSVYILSTEGVKLNIINTGINVDWFGSYLTVLNGNVYMTNPVNDKVYCFNVQGRLLSQTTIEESRPAGICVDRRNNKVFVCAWGHHKVYEFDSDLDRHKSVLGQTTQFMEQPEALCFYRGKLYVGHDELESSRVTVVRLV